MEPSLDADQFAGSAAKFSSKATWKGDRNGNNIEPMTVAVSWSFVQNP